MTEKTRSWDVLMIGGASGTGKTSISYRLAQYFGVGITEVDDFQVILEQMTTPEQQPILHKLYAEEAAGYSSDQFFKIAIEIGLVMSPALEVVIARHLESQTPIVLEGDFILPGLMMKEEFNCDQFHSVPSNNRVRAIILHEPDEQQLLDNFTRRDHSSAHGHRARVSFLYGSWLAREAERVGVIALPARPWDTLVERVLEAIR